jgi:serine protease Do
MRVAALIVIASCTSCASAQTQRSKALDPLREFSGTLQALSSRVTRSVVQVFASGYGLSEERDNPSTITRQRASGSGVVVSADGFIITNGHVVSNARKVRVRLPSERPPGSSVVQAGGPVVEAKLVGVDRETDLALLKVDGQKLAFLPFGDSESLRQGQLVFAFGSPMGMDNSMSMGVVSSNARQIKPDDAMIYVQTDASINPGNSGGPLVDADGDIVGINTFILSQSGGSEGLGFAIPSNIVNTVFRQLRDAGRVHRSDIGVVVQTITPALAGGLRLEQDWGVLIADVTPEGPAAKSGLEINDIVLTLNSKTMENARQFDVNLYRYGMGQSVKLEVLRGDRKLSIDCPVVDRPDDSMRFTDLIDPAKSMIPKLGVLGIEIDKRIASAIGGLRLPYGVVIAARAGESPYAGDALQLGDVIFSINGLSVTSVEALNQAIDGLKDSDPLVIRIQRGSGLRYLSLELQ